MPTNASLVVMVEESNNSVILRNDPPTVLNNKRRWERISLIISIFGRNKAPKDKSFMKIEKVALERKASIVANTEGNKLVTMRTGSKTAHVIGLKKRGRRWHRLALMLSAIKEIKEKRKSITNVNVVDPPETIAIAKNTQRSQGMAKFRRTIRLITMLSAMRRNCAANKPQSTESDPPILHLRMNAPIEIPVCEQRDRMHGWECDSGALSPQSPHEGNLMQIPPSRASEQTNVFIMNTNNSDSTKEDIKITPPTISTATSSHSLDKFSERSFWWWPFTHIFNDSKSVGSVTPQRASTAKLTRRHSIPPSNGAHNKMRNSPPGNPNIKDNNFFGMTSKKNHKLSPLFTKPSTVTPLSVIP